ncbi:MAG: hypothetical protein ACI8TX_001774, partial [Hyphomicrobiaceae bacterium]
RAGETVEDDNTHDQSTIPLGRCDDTHGMKRPHPLPCPRFITTLVEVLTSETLSPRKPDVRHRAPLGKQGRTKGPPISAIGQGAVQKWLASHARYYPQTAQGVGRLNVLSSGFMCEM